MTPRLGGCVRFYPSRAFAHSLQRIATRSLTGGNRRAELRHAGTKMPAFRHAGRDGHFSASLRRPVLYPTELRALFSINAQCAMLNAECSMACVHHFELWALRIEHCPLF